MKIKDLKDKKILVLGLGKEGFATLNFLIQEGVGKIFVADAKAEKDLSYETKAILKKEKIQGFFGDNYLKEIADFDLVIKSPGISPYTKGLEQAKKITSATEIFFANAKGFKIGITGSKGKSTTTTAIYEMLKQAGKEVVIVGNIGNPALEALQQDKKNLIYVIELSSYQLEKLPHSPDIAVLTAFFPEHLDYHQGFDNYLRAKMNIFKHQKKGDFAIVPAGFHLAPPNGVEKIEFNNLEGDYFLFKDEKVAEKSLVKLPGEHNLRNLTSAVVVAKLLEVDNESIQKALENLRPLPHRLSFVDKKENIEYWDDAISTTPDSTLAALMTFSGRVGSLFLGGYDRGLDFSDLAEEIIEQKIPCLVFFPNNGKRIWQSIKKQLPKGYYPEVLLTDDMQKAVKFVAKFTPKNKIALLSTASASYSLWKDFQEKGDKFIEAVGKL